MGKVRVVYRVSFWDDKNDLKLYNGVSFTSLNFLKITGLYRLSG